MRWTAFRWRCICVYVRPLDELWSHVWWEMMEELCWINNKGLIVVFVIKLHLSSAFQWSLFPWSLLQWIFMAEVYFDEGPLMEYFLEFWSFQECKFLRMYEHAHFLSRMCIFGDVYTFFNISVHFLIRSVHFRTSLYIFGSACTFLACIYMNIFYHACAFLVMSVLFSICLCIFIKKVCTFPNQSVHFRISLYIFSIYVHANF